MRDDIKWRLWIKESYRLSLNPLKDWVTVTLCTSAFCLGAIVRCLTG